MIQHLDNPRFPHTCVISRRVDDADPMTDDMSSVVVYEGICRGYDVQTTSDTGDVITSVRKLSLPVRQQEWRSAKPIPREGDMLALNRGSHMEYGRVTDIMSGNLGTHILWKYERN